MSQLPISKVVRQEEEKRIENGSFTPVPNFLYYDKTLDTYEFKILCFILSYHYLDDKQFSSRYIAESLNISRKKVMSSLSSLEEREYLELIEKGDYKEGKGSIYKCNVSIGIFMKKKDTKQKKEEGGHVDVTRTMASNEVHPLDQGIPPMASHGDQYKESTKRFNNILCVDENHQGSNKLKLESLLIIWTSFGLPVPEFKSIGSEMAWERRMAGKLLSLETPIECLEKAIDNYQQVIRDKTIDYNYEVTLEQFVSRKYNKDFFFERFLEGFFNINSFKRNKNHTNRMEEILNSIPEEKRYSFDFGVVGNKNHVEAEYRKNG